MHRTKTGDSAMSTFTHEQLDHLHTQALHRAALLRSEAIRAAWARMGQWLHGRRV
jgi:hypothetical protein